MLLMITYSPANVHNIYESFFMTNTQVAHRHRLCKSFVAEAEILHGIHPSGHNRPINLLVKKERQYSDGHDSVLSRAGLGIARCHDNFPEEVTALAQRQCLLRKFLAVGDGKSTLAYPSTPYGLKQLSTQIQWGQSPWYAHGISSKVILSIHMCDMIEKETLSHRKTIYPLKSAA